MDHVHSLYSYVYCVTNLLLTNMQSFFIFWTCLAGLVAGDIVFWSNFHYTTNGIIPDHAVSGVTSRCYNTSFMPPVCNVPSVHPTVRFFITSPTVAMSAFGPTSQVALTWNRTVVPSPVGYIPTGGFIGSTLGDVIKKGPENLYLPSGAFWIGWSDGGRYRDCNGWTTASSSEAGDAGGYSNLIRYPSGYGCNYIIEVLCCCRTSVAVPADEIVMSSGVIHGYSTIGLIIVSLLYT